MQARDASTPSLILVYSDHCDGLYSCINVSNLPRISLRKVQKKSGSLHAGLCPVQTATLAVCRFYFFFFLKIHTTHHSQLVFSSVVFKHTDSEFFTSPEVKKRPKKKCGQASCKKQLALTAVWPRTFDYVMKADMSVQSGQICQSKGLVSIDRSEAAALLSTTPRLRTRSSTNDFAPLRCMGWVFLRPGFPAPG